MPMNFYRKPQAKWDKRHLITVSTHLTRKQYDRLKRCAARDSVKVYRLIHDFLILYIRDRERAEIAELQSQIRDNGSELML